VHVSNLTHVIAVAAGAEFALALKDDGTVWAWGAGDQGELGRGTTSSSSTPLQVLTASGPLSDIVAIAAGARHALALTKNGSVLGWGDNAAGQVGPSGSDVLFATPIAGLSSITALAARNHHSLALDTSGKVYQWGAEEKKVGGGITWTNITTPTQVAFGAGVSITGVRAGYHHFLAIADDGTLYSWGLDYSGELFGQAGVDRSTPAVASTFAGGLVDFAAGGAFVGSHSMYITKDAQVSGAGASTYGQSTGFP
jgi:alpha-tubulin suppressor-like RCC1 family protein